MKKLVQFNELVFNHTVNIKEVANMTTKFKDSKQEYAYGHGDYMPQRCGERKLASKTVDVEMVVDQKKFNCEDRDYIDEFVKMNFGKVGRLWAVQGDILLWTIARVEEFTEGYEEKLGYLTYDVTFYQPEGVWHIADATATYLHDYSLCDVLECYDRLDRKQCECSYCNIGAVTESWCKDDCDGTPLCQIPKGDLKDQIGKCGNMKRIQFSCRNQQPSAETKSAYDSSTAYVEFDNATLYPTDDVVIEICGEFKDLVIEWNGEKSIIEGHYKGDTLINGGLVKNECKFLDFGKFHSICSHEDCPANTCEKPFTEIGVNPATGNLVQFKAKAGTNNVVFYNLDENDVQEIKIWVDGIAI